MRPLALHMHWMDKFFKADFAVVSSGQCDSLDLSLNKVENIPEPDKK